MIYYEFQVQWINSPGDDKRDFFQITGAVIHSAVVVLVNSEVIIVVYSISTPAFQHLS